MPECANETALGNGVCRQRAGPPDGLLWNTVVVIRGDRLRSRNFPEEKVFSWYNVKET